MMDNKKSKKKLIAGFCVGLSVVNLQPLIAENISNLPLPVKQISVNYHGLKPVAS